MSCRWFRSVLLAWSTAGLAGALAPLCARLRHGRRSRALCSGCGELWFGRAPGVLGRGEALELACGQTIAALSRSSSGTLAPLAPLFAANASQPTPTTPPVGARSRGE